MMGTAIKVGFMCNPHPLYSGDEGNEIERLCSDAASTENY